MDRKIGVIGLGYVGLPVAIAFARKITRVVGYDINPAKIIARAAGHDKTGEVDDAELRETSLKFSSDVRRLVKQSFGIFCPARCVIHLPTSAKRFDCWGISRIILSRMGGSNFRLVSAAPGLTCDYFDNEVRNEQNTDYWWQCTVVG